MLKKIQDCFEAERLYYSSHARDEMEADEFGEIKDEEVFESVRTGKIIEHYPEDEPYPSCLIYGRTSKDRPIHVGAPRRRKLPAGESPVREIVGSSR